MADLRCLDGLLAACSGAVFCATGTSADRQFRRGVRLLKAPRGRGSSRVEDVTTSDENAYPDTARDRHVGDGARPAGDARSELPNGGLYRRLVVGRYDSAAV